MTCKTRFKCKVLQLLEFYIKIWWQGELPCIPRPLTLSWKPPFVLRILPGMPSILRHCSCVCRPVATHRGLTAGLWFALRKMRPMQALEVGLGPCGQGIPSSWVPTV